jgi:hypothetical protein
MAAIAVYKLGLLLACLGSWTKKEEPSKILSPREKLDVIRRKVSKIIVDI